VPKNSSKNTKNDANAIIGHFGLGFYSSFMVSKRVEIVTKILERRFTGRTLELRRFSPSSSWKKSKKKVEVLIFILHSTTKNT
jgi:hypothetical protein